MAREQELDCAITECKLDADIIYMNDKAKKTFAKWGDDLTGRNLKECHGAKSWDTIREMILQNRENHYTITKGGVKKIIHQQPHYINGEIAGLVEFSFEIPLDMPHFDRG